MKIAVDSTPPARKRTPALCLFVPEGGAAGYAAGGPKLEEAVEAAAERVGGRAGAVRVIESLDTAPAGAVVVAGTGAGPAGADALMSAAGSAAKAVREMGLPRFAAAVPGGADAAAGAAAVVQGAALALYAFDRFRSRKEKAAPAAMDVMAPRAAAVLDAVRIAEAAAGGTILARDVANMPPNACPPAEVASQARKACARGGGKAGKLRCSVLKGAELESRGFGGILAVGGGSRNGPRLAVMEHSGAGRAGRPVVLVGKAVTFDTGGISLKPGARMDEMKFDKAGGCAVIGIVSAAARMRLPVNLVGLVPSVENMPGGGAYRPGDVVELYGGRTAEIVNTDAEGRLILADALAYGAAKYRPAAMIDLATLTGACVVALGANVAGMVSNDDSLASGIAGAGSRTGEEVWRLPLNDDHMDMIKSDVADVKNVGAGRAAGAITAAAFLRGAVGDTPWAHLDIAGTAWTQEATRKRPYNPKGATGFGVRLVLEYLRSRVAGR